MVSAHQNSNIDLPSQVIIRLLELLGTHTPSVKIVKLVYLVDYTYYQHYGTTLSGLEYRWGPCDPNAIGHGIVNLADRMANEHLIERTEQPNGYGGETIFYSRIKSASGARLNAQGEMVIGDIVAQYGQLSVHAITEVSKKTAPFANAEQYDRLEMKHSIPAISALESDWDGFLAELNQHGTVSLEQLVDENGSG